MFSFHTLASFATEAFEDVGHSTDARELMEKYLIGEMAEVSTMLSLLCLYSTFSPSSIVKVIWDASTLFMHAYLPIYMSVLHLYITACLTVLIHPVFLVKEAIHELIRVSESFDLFTGQITMNYPSVSGAYHMYYPRYYIKVSDTLEL